MEEKLIKKTKESIEKILEEGIQNSNLDFLDKLVDIYKDTKEVESMNYEGYGRGGYGRGGYGRGEYGRGEYGRGEYGRGEYGRGGYGARYRGDQYLESMYGNYGRYEEGRGSYNRGNYGAKEQTLNDLECMLEATADFFKMLKEEAHSQEEMNLIKKYTQEISK